LAYGQLGLDVTISEMSCRWQNFQLPFEADTQARGIAMKSTLSWSSEG
jgi:hypothetical protein